ncbi:hypothetical protein ACHAPJ_007077 [Fusarium lateritium]
MSSQEEEAREQHAMQVQRQQMQMMMARQRQQQFLMLQQRQQQNANLMGNQMGQQMAPQNQMAQQFGQQMQMQMQMQPQMSQQMGQSLPGTMGTGMAAQTGLPMGTSHDDVPITGPNDLAYLNGPAGSHPEFESFVTACEEGDLSTVESIVTSQPRTPVFLHQGLLKALHSGKVDVARHLLESKAPITRITPTHILRSTDQRIPLFELLTEHGWTVNTPGFYGAVLLPSVIHTKDDALIDWFLSHGADPSLGTQRDNRDRFGGPDTDSCEALEIAATEYNAETVQKLLNAGAKIGNGTLYFAAGVCPQGSNPHAGLVTPSREFDEARIPAMALLVENGADVNGKYDSRHMTAQYPIVNAVMAGAVERVKWLLSQGADPDLQGQYGSARDYARRNATDEMKRVLET